MNCIKLLDPSLMARDFDGQVVELQVSFAVLNGDTDLAIPVTEVVGESVRGSETTARSSLMQKCHSQALK